MQALNDEPNDAAFGGVDSAIDWPATVFGARESWSAQFRAIATMCRTAPAPTVVFWGPSQAPIYNEPFARMLGVEHRIAVGRPLDAGSETHEMFAALVRAVRASERETLVARRVLRVRRDDVVERSALTFTCARVDDEPETPAVVCAVAESVSVAESDGAEAPDARKWFDRPGDQASSDAAYREAADQLPIMVYQHDAAGALSFTNHTWHETLRLPRDPSSHTAEMWATVVHPDDMAATIAIASAAIAERAPYEIEYRLRAADGADPYRWYIARGLPFFTNDGTFHGWNCSIVDIHESRLREESERALRVEATKGQRELRVLADTIPAMVWTASADGSIESFNRQWSDYTGFSEAEMLGWGWQPIVHPDDLHDIMDRWPGAIATGEPFEVQLRLRRRDGAYRMFLSRGLPVRDEAGTVYRWYGTTIDVNDQRDALERSRRVAASLQGVFVPGTLPHTDRVRIDAVYEAAETDALVGGDWFDALAMPDGRFLLSIGDVTGHGLDASIVASRLRHAMIDFALVHASPADVLDAVNESLRLTYRDVYASGLVALFDPRTGRLDYASAGHPGPFMADRTTPTARALPGGGLLLGVAERVDAVAHTLELPEAAVVAFYTDGIVEFARDAETAERRLAEATASLVDQAGPHPAALLRDIVLDGAKPVDDIAILVVQFANIAHEITAPRDVRKHWRFHSSDARTVHVARLQIVDYLRGYSDDEDAIAAAELVLGELLANTVEHAPGLVEVAIDWTGDLPVVTFLDRGPGVEGYSTDLPAQPYAESGRGLFLVNRLSEDLVVRKRPEGGTETRLVLRLRKSGATPSSGRN